jgi:hypothetical protein
MCEGCIHIGRFHLDRLSQQAVVGDQVDAHVGHCLGDDEHPLHEEDNGNAEGVGERDRNADPGKRLRNKVSSPHQ